MSSEARILTLLRNAYSQNYLYLIKKPEDQYQVILEMEDSAARIPKTWDCSISNPTTDNIWFRSGSWSPGNQRLAHKQSTI